MYSFQPFCFLRMRVCDVEEGKEMREVVAQTTSAAPSFSLIPLVCCDFFVH